MNFDDDENSNLVNSSLSPPTDCSVFDCSALYWWHATGKQLLQLTVLIVLNVVIIFGNGLVIVAVVVKKKLRTLTTYLITSLAIADIMIGLSVLPFSTFNQMYDRWYFGEVWCQIWLAIDVWMCTASIYNLTAIAVDRFVAIVKPLMYPSILTPRRGKFMIFMVWFTSFMICFPPMIVQWPKIFSTSEGTVNATGQCTPMDNSPAYIVYSAFGSFFAPMIVITTLYVRIYWTVRRSAQSLMSGYINVRSKRGVDVSGAQQQQLRMHKGRIMTQDINANNTGASNSDNQIKKDVTARHNSEPATADGPFHKFMQRRSTFFQLRPQQTGAASTQRLLRRVNKECFAMVAFAVDGANADNFAKTWTVDDEMALAYSGRDSVDQGSVAAGASIYFRRCRDNLLSYHRKMRLEIRAAKTVAIVTGCFVFCWLGFSIIYLLKAFPYCNSNCIPEAVFGVFFWLGYANSALNPLIYAVFNQEFRRAFRSLLCCDTDAEDVLKKRKLNASNAYKLIASPKRTSTHS